MFVYVCMFVCSCLPVCFLCVCVCVCLLPSPARVWLLATCKLCTNWLVKLKRQVQSPGSFNTTLCFCPRRVVFTVGKFTKFIHTNRVFKCTTYICILVHFTVPHLRYKCTKIEMWRDFCSWEQSFRKCSATWTVFLFKLLTKQFWIWGKVIYIRKDPSQSYHFGKIPKLMTMGERIPDKVSIKHREQWLLF